MKKKFDPGLIDSIEFEFIHPIYEFYDDRWIISGDISRSKVIVRVI